MNVRITVAGVEFPREERRRRLQHRDVLAEPLHLRPQPSDLGRLLAVHTFAVNGVDVGLREPPAQRLVCERGRSLDKRIPHRIRHPLAPQPLQDTP